EPLKVLLNKHRNEIEITKGVIEAAAGNSSSGKEVIALLLDPAVNRVVVTLQLVQALAKSFDALAMKKLLMYYGDKLKITEEVAEAAAGNWNSGKEVMALLPDQRDEANITKEVVEAAAWNCSGKEVMVLLLDQRSNEVRITEEVVKAAARNDTGTTLLA
ncbi:hypothetical protein K469DRAFT_521781, partial [Zopfia rhizophila CBS 207.26]